MISRFVEINILLWALAYRLTAKLEITLPSRRRFTYKGLCFVTVLFTDMLIKIFQSPFSYLLLRINQELGD